MILAVDGEMPWWSWVLFVPTFLGLAAVSMRQVAKNLHDWYHQHKEQWPRP